MKKYLLILLGAFLLGTTTTYAQELTAKEKARQEKEAAKQEKENAKKDAKMKKAADKDARIENLRIRYEQFLTEWEPIEANTGVSEVDTFFINTNELFELLCSVEQNIGFIEMLPDPYFDEEMGVHDTAWIARHKVTGEEIKKSDALNTYTIATLNLTEAAARSVGLTAQGVSALAALTADPLKALSLGKRVKNSGRAIKMSVDVIPLIQRSIKENTEKLQYRKANEAKGELEDEIATEVDVDTEG